MGVRRSWNFSFPAWRNVCPRSGPCRSIAFPSKTLLVRIRRGLYRMHLHPIRDDTWSIRDYRALPRIGEDIVFKRAGSSAGLNLNVRGQDARALRTVPVGYVENWPFIR